MDALTSWLINPSSSTGIYFARQGLSWDFHSYDELAKDALSVGRRLQQTGALVGDVVSIVVDTSPEFVTTFFGTLAIGAVACPIPPPSVFQNREAYVGQLMRVFSIGHPKVVVVGNGFEAEVASAIAALDEEPRLLVAASDWIQGSLDVTGGDGEVGLLQFTSGSSGSPRGTLITRANLLANIAMIRDWLSMASNDVTATWLPLFHDMGLIGCLATPAVAQTSVMVMRPEQFIRNPARWLECFGSGRATLTAAPTFALRYIAQRVRPHRLEGLDFSRWRALIVGAERVDAGSLLNFAELLRPYGFSSAAFAPAYGLAEATLAVTAVRPGVKAPSAIDLDGVAFGQAAAARPHPLSDCRSKDCVVACGAPLDGVSVSIVDEQGRPLAPGSVGEIIVEGPTVALGYLADDDSTSERFRTTGLKTGDAGVIVDGELVVLGRLGDSLKVRGRTVFVEDVEARLMARHGLPLGRVAVVAGTIQGRQHLVLLTEINVDTAALETSLRAEVDVAVAVAVVRCKRGALQFTSSGKPRRTKMLRALERELTRNPDWRTMTETNWEHA